MAAAASFVAVAELIAAVVARFAPADASAASSVAVGLFAASVAAVAVECAIVAVHSMQPAAVVAASFAVVAESVSETAIAEIAPAASAVALSVVAVPYDSFAVATAHTAAYGAQCNAVAVRSAAATEYNACARRFECTADFLAFATSAAALFDRFVADNAADRPRLAERIVGCTMVAVGSCSGAIAAGCNIDSVAAVAG